MLPTDRAHSNSRSSYPRSFWQLCIQTDTWPQVPAFRASLPGSHPCNFPTLPDSPEDLTSYSPQTSMFTHTCSCLHYLHDTYSPGSQTLYILSPIINSHYLLGTHHVLVRVIRTGGLCAGPISKLEPCTLKCYPPRFTYFYEDRYSSPIFIMYSMWHMWCILTEHIYIPCPSQPILHASLIQNMLLGRACLLSLIIG